MSDSVKKFTVDYSPINESNVFSSGDTVRGQVTLELSQECNVNSLWVEMKGEATVKWTENHGGTEVTYSDEEKYFSIKTQLIQGGKGYNILRAGANTFPFTFQIPAQDLPPSFKDASGKIEYTLEANLSRSVKVVREAKAEFTVVHKASLNSDPMMMNQQHDTTSNKMRLFSSGTVGMDVKLERTGYVQGEDISVVAVIDNRSSQKIKLEYCLYKKYSYIAKKWKRLSTKDIVKEMGEEIPPNCYQTVFRTISIPPSTCPSVLNCKIIKAEYLLRVNLDVKIASDPEIKFPVIILPKGVDMQMTTAPPFPATSPSLFSTPSPSLFSTPSPAPSSPFSSPSPFPTPSPFPAPSPFSTSSPSSPFSSSSPFSTPSPFPAPSPFSTPSPSSPFSPPSPFSTPSPFPAFPSPSPGPSDLGFNPLMPTDLGGPVLPPAPMFVVPPSPATPYPMHDPFPSSSDYNNQF